MGGGQPGGELPLPLMARPVEGFRASMYTSLHSQGGGRVILSKGIFLIFYFLFQKRIFRPSPSDFRFPPIRSIASFIHTKRSVIISHYQNENGRKL